MCTTQTSTFCEESKAGDELSPSALSAATLIGKNKVDVVLGAQWGDEGKGKLVDILSEKYDICARVAGGSNAGHTIVVDVRSSRFSFIIISFV